MAKDRRANGVRPCRRQMRMHRALVGQRLTSLSQEQEEALAWKHLRPSLDWNAGVAS
jgi:hypothetical protein